MRQMFYKRSKIDGCILKKPKYVEENHLDAYRPENC